MSDPTLTGRAVLDADGQQVGEVVGLLVSATDRRARWVRVSLPDGTSRLVPASAASAEPAAVRLPWNATTVLAAPPVDGDEVGDEQARALLRHYGFGDGG